MRLKFRDFTTGAFADCPVLPKTYTRERGQSLGVFAVLGSYPIAQIGATDLEKWSCDLELYGEQGLKFWRDFLEPSLGGFPAYRPHKMQVAWGESSRNAFSGYAVGLPSTEFAFGVALENLGSISLSYELVKIQNQALTTLDKKTNQPVQGLTTTYRTKAGETLGSIARKFGVTLSALADANGGNPPLALTPGTKLIIPGAKR
jgi:hypothetical protein